MSDRRCLGLVVGEAGGTIKPDHFELRNLKDDDVEIEVLFCGICHTDLHYIGNDWGNTHFPLVPGHEVIGNVIGRGRKATKFEVGDRVGVGYIVGSCRKCDECRTGRENYCDEIITTLSGVMPDGEVTKGGWSKRLVASEQFIIRVPDNLDAASAAPLLCAGVTVFSPIKHWDMGKPGNKIGIVGLGGLGHLAVLFAAAKGAEVVVFDINPNKSSIALELGATKFVNCSDPHQMEVNRGTLHFIIDTAPSPKAIEPFLELLKTDGVIISIGLPTKDFKIQVPPAVLSFKRRSLQGTLTGSVSDAQEMLDFAGKHNITAWIEVIGANELQSALDRMVAGDVKFRFVLDMKTLHEEIIHARSRLGDGGTHEPVHSHSGRLALSPTASKRADQLTLSKI